MSNDDTLVTSEGTCSATVFDLGNELLDNATKCPVVYDDFIFKKTLENDDLLNKEEVGQDFTKPYRIVFRGELTHE